MKKFFLCFSVFFSIFSMGIAVVLFLKISNASVSSQPPDPPSPAEAAGKSADRMPSADAPRHLRPLALPLGATAERCVEKSWEFSGEADGNVVSARGRLVASFCNQGWTPDKKITLDKTISPREILTFTKGKYELILMIWKISGNVTGFTYRRDLLNKTIGKVIQ